MRKLTYILLLLGFHIGFAQTDADYDKSITTAIEAFKTGDEKKVFDLFSTDLQTTLSAEKIKELLTGTVKEFGAPSGEFDFMMEEEGVKRYLIQTDVDSFMLEIKLSGDLKITSFSVH